VLLSRAAYRFCSSDSSSPSLSKIGSKFEVALHKVAKRSRCSSRLHPATATRLQAVSCGLPLVADLQLTCSDVGNLPRGQLDIVHEAGTRLPHHRVLSRAIR